MLAEYKSTYRQRWCTDSWWLSRCFPSLSSEILLFLIIKHKLPLHCKLKRYGNNRFLFCLPCHGTVTNRARGGPRDLFDSWGRRFLSSVSFPLSPLDPCGLGFCYFLFLKISPSCSHQLQQQGWPLSFLVCIGYRCWCCLPWKRALCQ